MMAVQSGIPDAATTCSVLLRRLFPPLDPGDDIPYLAFPSRDGTEVRAYGTPPLLPPDVFAAAAHLLDLSGAYHHVLPDLPRDPGRARAKRLVVVAEVDLVQARAVAEAWRAFHPGRDFTAWVKAGKKPEPKDDGSALNLLYDWWTDVFDAAGGEPVFQMIEAACAPPRWWKSALMLMTAADEASRGLGYQIHVAHEAGGDDTPWIAKMIEAQMVDIFERRGVAIDDPPGAAERFTAVSTISFADPDVVAVLPKARTPSVGCTLRSLSHHLALLPPRGVARASWTPYLFHSPPPDEQHLNLLLVPFPFSVPARAFQPAASSGGDGMKWGLFDVTQTWLDDVGVTDMLAFIRALAAQAEVECDGIHGVVFPEMALDHNLFEHLSEQLPQVLPNIELLVAGQSGDPSRRPGNFVSVAVYQQAGENEKKKHGLVTRREKHHRWKLDRSQIVDYGLEGTLSPSRGWWENIDLLSRRVDFSVFRAHSVFSAMICEDLARVDPCQELLRSIGPSLVFALLMDAPQLQARWPGRYATVLAEDPGSAVLTLTSRALMTRQDRLGLRRSRTDDDRVIGLWRDDGGEYREISCPEDAQAVRLTLSGQPSVDVTLDGRSDPTAVSWRYAAHRPIRVPGAETTFRAILGRDEGDAPVSGRPERTPPRIDAPRAG